MIYADENVWVPVADGLILISVINYCRSAGSGSPIRVAQRATGSRM